MQKRLEVRWRHGGGNPSAHANGRKSQAIGGRKCAPDALRKGVGVGNVAAGEQNGELLAAEPGDDINAKA